MSQTAHAVADTQSESYPAYTGQMHYVEGYEPVSLVAPHSSLVRSRTWIGMGVVLATLCPLGMLIWVAAMQGMPTEAPFFTTTYLIVGLVLAACSLGVGSFLIWSGRGNYRKYRKATGRRN